MAEMINTIYGKEIITSDIDIPGSVQYIRGKK